MKFFVGHTKERTEIFLYCFLCVFFVELQFCFIYTFKYVHIIIFQKHLATISFKCLFGSSHNCDRGVMNHSVTENKSKLIRIGCQIFCVCILCWKIFLLVWDYDLTTSTPVVVKLNSLSVNANGFVDFYSVIESATLSRAGGQADTDGRSDKRDEDNSYFSQF